MNKIIITCICSFLVLAVSKHSVLVNGADEYVNNDYEDTVFVSGSIVDVKHEEEEEEDEVDDDEILLERSPRSAKAAWFRTSVSSNVRTGSTNFRGGNHVHNYNTGFGIRSNLFNVIFATTFVLVLAEKLLFCD